MDMWEFEKYTWKPSRDANQFLKFDIPETWKGNCGGDYWNFNEGEVRESIKKIYDKDSNYVLLNVAANPEADKLLRKYVGEFKWINEGKEGYSEYHKAKKAEKDYCLGLDLDLTEEYLSVLKTLADAYLGEKNHVSFPIVKGNCNEVFGAAYWPIVFVLNERGDSATANRFRGLVGKLNDEDSYELLKKKEHPQNYNIASIDILRDKNVLPLIVKPEEWRVSAENLKNAINFLVPFDLECEDRNSSGMEDGL